MRNYFEQREPNQNRQFRRRWSSSLPSTPDEIKLTQLRAAHGNGAGTRLYLAARRGERVRT